MEQGNKVFERQVEREKIHIHSMPFIWLATIIGGIVFFIIDRTMCFDYILGAVAGMFGLTMMLYTVNTSKMEHLKTKMILNYFIRYIMYGIIFAIVWLVDGVKFIWVPLVGIVVVKVVLVIYALIHKGEKV